ncbi:hypothetical protein [Paenibacillus hubeiensis]|uniref:hypothetical protein n=1 Tax=Paenibacillus hubeiensis TaxID=3077330 RepID=UPI0031BAC303
MIDEIFCKDDKDQLHLNGDVLLEKTDWEFANVVVSRIGEERVKEMSFGGDRRTKFVYFRTAAGLFSFAWDSKAGALLFSEQVKRDWKFVIGWQPA